VDFYCPGKTIGSDTIFKNRGKKNNMKTIVIVLLVCVVSPALADVYRCDSGSKTIYQDVPCPNAKVIDNINGQAPSRHEQLRAMERTTRHQALATRLREGREAEERRTTRTTTTTTIQTTVIPGAVARKPNGPDRYYDRPDRYYDRPDRFKHRAVSGTTYIQHK